MTSRDTEGRGTGHKRVTALARIRLKNEIILTVSKNHPSSIQFLEIKAIAFLETNL
jgi:hypothetical protein